MIVKNMAQVPFHGDVDGMASNLSPIVRLFPTWNLKEADGLRRFSLFIIQVMICVYNTLMTRYSLLSGSPRPCYNQTDPFL